MTPFLILLMAVFGAHAYSDVSWDPISANIVIDEGASTAKATFILHNSGFMALSIESVNTDCGCTTASIGGTTIEPNASTQLRVLVELRKDMRIFEKHVIVKLSNREEPYMLTIRGSPKDVIRSKPSFLYWTLNSNQSEEALEITPVSAGDKVISVKSLTDKVVLSDDHQDDAGGQTMHVKPKTTNELFEGKIEVVLEDAKGRRSSDFVYVFVK